MHNYVVNKYSNFTAPEIGEACLQVPLESNNNCLSAGSSCKDKKCEALFTKYVEALKKGYKKSFTSFKKEANILGYISTGLNIGSGFFGNPNQAPAITPDEKKDNTPLYIGISVGVVAIGITIYLIVKNRWKN